jgi:hypothetical protein
MSDPRFQLNSSNKSIREFSGLFDAMGIARSDLDRDYVILIRHPKHVNSVEVGDR